MRESRLIGFGWWVMSLLALGVAAYTSMAVWNPEAIEFIASRVGPMRLTLILHAAAGTVALLLGPLQFVDRIRRGRPLWHRMSGRIYLICVLVGGVSGLWLSFHTRGGVAASGGFFVLSVLWLVSGTLAWRAVLKRDYAAHRAWMMRSYALTFGAVSLRIYLGLGVPLAGLPFNQVYGAAAWASWVINLLFVEWVLLPRLGPVPARTTAEKFASPSAAVRMTGRAPQFIVDRICRSDSM